MCRGSDHSAKRHVQRGIRIGVSDLSAVWGCGVEEPPLQAYEGSQSFLRGISGASAGQDGGNESGDFVQGFAQRRRQGVDNTFQRRLGVLQRCGRTLFEPLHERLFDCVNQLLFAGEPSVDAPDGDSGVFGDAGDCELLGSVVD